MDADHQPRELTEPAQMPRTELPHDPPLAAHAACEDCDEPDTDVELAEDEAPGPEQQFSGD